MWGEFYAKAVVVYITTAFYATGFGVNPLVKSHGYFYKSYSYIKGKFYASNLN